MIRFIALVLCLVMLPCAFGATPGGASSPYSIQTDTLDAGGHVATNSVYTQIGSFGGIEGRGSVSTYAAGHGYIAQLAGVSAPSISSFSNQLIQMNATTGALNFSVADYETSISVATTAVVSATSSNTTLVPNNPANLSVSSLTSSGAQTATGTLTVNPASNQFGTTTITVTATDSEGNKASTSFLLDVNAPPVVARNNGQGVNSQSFTDISNANLQVNDGDNTPAQRIYTVTIAPAAGTLRFYPVYSPLPQSGGTAINASSTFTQDDIDNLRIRYSNQSGTQDAFTFTVSDSRGGTISATVFSITVGAGAGVTSTAPSIPTVSFSPLDQIVPVTATVTSGGAGVNKGAVTFQIVDANSVNVGAAVTTSTVANGVFSANYTVPGGTPITFYTLTANYLGSDTFKTSAGSLNFAVIQPGGTQPPSILSLTVDRNPAVVGTPVTITASAQINSGLNPFVTYTFNLFKHNDPTLIKTLQSDARSSLTTTFTNEGDFDISVVVSDGINASAAGVFIEVFPLGPNPGTIVANIFNDNGATGGATNPSDNLAIIVSSSQGGALNFDGSTTQTPSFRAVGDTFKFTIPEQTFTDPNRPLTGGKFKTPGIRVIQLDATIAGGPKSVRLLLPLGRPETDPSNALPDMRTSAGKQPMSYNLKKSKLSQTKPASVQLSCVIEMSAGLLLSDMTDIEFGLTKLHTKILVDTKGKVQTNQDTAHFSKIKVSMPKQLDKTSHKTLSGATMTITFTLTGSAQEIRDSLSTEGVLPVKSPVKGTTQIRTLQYAAIVAGMTYQSNLMIIYTPNDDFGSISGRSAKP